MYIQFRIQFKMMQIVRLIFCLFLVLMLNYGSQINGFPAYEDQPNDEPNDDILEDIVGLSFCKYNATLKRDICNKIF
ncbi:unnamed protein product [Gordionus sp. m RMFG-2023]